MIKPEKLTNGEFLRTPCACGDETHLLYTINFDPIDLGILPESEADQCLIDGTASFTCVNAILAFINDFDETWNNMLKRQSEIDEIAAAYPEIMPTVDTSINVTEDAPLASTDETPAVSDIDDSAAVQAVDTTSTDAPTIETVEPAPVVSVESEVQPQPAAPDVSVDSSDVAPVADVAADNTSSESVVGSQQPEVAQVGESVETGTEPVQTPVSDASDNESVTRTVSVSDAVVETSSAPVSDDSAAVQAVDTTSTDATATDVQATDDAAAPAPVVADPVEVDVTVAQTDAAPAIAPVVDTATDVISTSDAVSIGSQTSPTESVAVEDATESVDVDDEVVQA